MHHTKTLLFFLFPLVIFAQPEVKWRKALKNGIQSINSAVDFSVDKSGNVFIAGSTNEPDSAKKILLVKLDSSGTEQWRRIFQTEPLSNAVAVALALDLSGNAVLTGTIMNAKGNSDIVTLKYSTDGILLWQNFYGGKANLFDAPSAIAIDKKGNVLVCGFETASEANPDLLLLRYSSGGERSFVKNFSTAKMDVGVDVAIDDSCNIYVCGNISVSTRSADIMVMKFDSSGNSKWNYTYDGPEHTVDVATDFAFDDSTNIFITGSANHSNDKADIPLIKLNRNGKLIGEQLISAGIADGTGGKLTTGGKTVFLQTTFTDFLQQSVTGSMYLADKTCKQKFNLKPPNEDINYLVAYPWQNNSTLLFGSVLTRPENTIAPYIEIQDSLHHKKMSYQDDVLISLLRIKNVLLAGSDIYFLGDDATENAGTISIVKYSLPEVPKNKPKVSKPKTK